MMAGVWMRLLIETSLVPVIMGSFLEALGNIFIINSPSKFASTWFRPSMIAKVTTMGVMCNLASLGLGVALPSVFVNEESTKSDVVKLLMYEAIIVSVPCLLVLFLFRGKPKTPPSHAADIKNDRNYTQDLKMLFKNRNYLFLLVAVSMSYGSLTCFTTVIEYIILPFKFPEPQKLASYILLVAIGVGIFSSIVFVLVLKRSLEYKKILIFGSDGLIQQ